MDNDIRKRLKPADQMHLDHVDHTAHNGTYKWNDVALNSRRKLVLTSELLRVRSERFARQRERFEAVQAQHVPKSVAPAVPLANTVAFNIFIIAVLAAIGSGTTYLNWAFLIYGVLVLAFRAASERIFGAALICLVLIPVCNALQRAPLGNTFAVMTFYFLLIGLIRAIIENRGQTDTAEPGAEDERTKLKRTAHAAYLRKQASRTGRLPGTAHKQRRDTHAIPRN